MPKDRNTNQSTPDTLSGGLHGDDGTQSLGDQQTFSGANHGNAPQSLGDEATRGGIGADEDVAFDDDMELVDLSARYVIEGRLGQGGMGEVLLATDQRLKRKVAIKRVLGDKVHSRTALQRFLTEAQSVAALNHPNIVQIYDYGRDQAGPFLIMEHVDGISLLDRCRNGVLPLEDAIKLTCQLCDGLEVAHAVNIIHRDVKPANVLLTKSGMPKLTDFGLAKDESADSSHTLTGAVLGTLDFMPPEQRKDAALTDARSDLWSLAATLYQLVTGKTPKIIRLNTLPASLQDVLSQALEDNPDDRFQTAAEFREALQACLKESGSRSVSDPSAAVDLEEGTCLGCGTKNDLIRKFCRKCASPLRVSCLACEVELPIWDNICGGCGANQQQLATSRRSELDAQRAEAESFLSQYQFRKALKLAREISLVTDLRLQHLKGWAESFLSATETEQKRQEENAISHFAEAQSHRTAFDYPAAIHAMQSIPEVMRTSEMQSYLQALQSDHDEVTGLIEAISNCVKRRDLDGLLEPVSRAVELRGDRADLRTLLTQLTERQEKLIRQRDEAYHQSKMLLDQGRAKEALELVHTIKASYLRLSDLPDLEFKRRLERVVKAEEELAALVKASKAHNVLEPEEVVAMLAGAEECLRGNPSHEKIKALREQLIQRILSAPDAYSGQQLASLPNYVLKTLSPSILAKLPKNVLQADEEKRNVPGMIVLHRKATWSGFMCSIHVTVDGIEKGKLNAFEEIKFEVAPGEHIIKVSAGGLRNSLRVDINCGESLRFETDYSDWGILGGGLNLKPL